MIQIISEPVSVITTFDAGERKVRPVELTWSRRTYPVRLNLNADTLSWTLEEVSDGLPD